MDVRLRHTLKQICTSLCMEETNFYDSFQTYNELFIQKYEIFHILRFKTINCFVPCSHVSDDNIGKVLCKLHVSSSSFQFYSGFVPVTEVPTRLLHVGCTFIIEFYSTF